MSTLTRRELGIIVQYALKAPGTVQEGVDLRPLLEKAVGIVNGPSDMESQPYPSPVEVVTSDNP